MIKKHQGSKGKYCTFCNTVWEFIPLVGIVRHPDFPSYGLERENCSKCGDISTETKVTSTLAEEAAEQCKILFNKEIEKRNK